MKDILTKNFNKDKVVRNWHLYDVAGVNLGRATTEIAKLLIGKHKTTYSFNVDCGDYVVVINSSKVKISGNKAEDKEYYRHSGYPGGIKKRTYSEIMDIKPEEIIMHSVKGMLPKNRLQNDRLKRLKVFRDSKHPYDDKLKTSKK